MKLSNAERGSYHRGVFPAQPRLGELMSVGSPADRGHFGFFFEARLIFFSSEFEMVFKSFEH